MTTRFYRSLSLTLCVAGLLLSAGPAVAGPEEKFAGEWSAKMLMHAGLRWPVQAVKPKYVFKGDTLKVEMTLRQGLTTENYKLTFDDTKTPAHITWTRTDGRAAGKVYQGIYKFKDGELTLCMDARAQNKRPKKFASNRNNGAMLIVLRKKDAPAKQDEDGAEQDDKANAADNASSLKKLQGRWRLVAGETGGHVSSPDEIKKQKMTITIKDKTATWVTSRRKTDGSFDTVFTIKINTAKSPAQIDFTEKGGRRTNYKGIFKFKNGKLVICLNLMKNKPRPKVFKTAYGESTSRMELKLDK